MTEKPRDLTEYEVFIRAAYPSPRIYRAETARQAREKAEQDGLRVRAVKARNL